MDCTRWAASYHFHVVEHILAGIPPSWSATASRCRALCRPPKLDDKIALARVGEGVAACTVSSSVSPLDKIDHGRTCCSRSMPAGVRARWALRPVTTNRAVRIPFCQRGPDLAQPAGAEISASRCRKYNFIWCGKRSDYGGHSGTVRQAGTVRPVCRHPYPHRSAARALSVR